MLINNSPLQPRPFTNGFSLVILDKKLDGGDVRLESRFLAQHNTRMGEVYQEVSNFSKTKEVQAMLLAEQFINADLDALKSYERREGIAAEKGVSR